jgi:hypothetical protein
MSNIQGTRPEAARFNATLSFLPEEEKRLPERILPVHLLVVDDEEHIREVCRVVAEDSGMKICEES